MEYMITLGQIGLLFDIAGVILLFRFGLPSRVEFDSYTEINEKDTEKNKHIARMSHLGILLLVFGFILQLISPWFGNLLELMSCCHHCHC